MLKAEASLLALWLEGTLHGVYTVLFGACIYALLRQRDKQATSTVLTCAVVTMYVIATTHMGLVVYRAVLTFVHAGTALSGAEGSSSKVADPLELSQTILFIANGLVADCLLIFRCSVVWRGRIWVCLFPALLLIVSTASGIWFNVAFAQAPFKGAGWRVHVMPWMTTFVATTLATNVLVTSLIASRVWWITRQSTRNPGHRGASVRRNAALLGIIESGAIYCMAMVVFFVIYKRRLAELDIMCQTLTQIAGMAPTLIVVQVRLGLTIDKMHSVPSSTTAVELPLHSARSPNLVSPRSPRTTYEGHFRGKEYGASDAGTESSVRLE